MITIEPFDADKHGVDLYYLKLRAIDEFEARAVFYEFNDSPMGYLLLYVCAQAFTAYVVKVNGTIEAVFGLSPGYTDEDAMPWFVASDVVYKHKKTLVKLAKEWVAKFESMGFKTYHNYVSEYNHDAIKLLKWLGFDVETRLRLYYGTQPFYHFWKERQVT